MYRALALAVGLTALAGCGSKKKPVEYHMAKESPMYVVGERSTCVQVGDDARLEFNVHEFSMGRKKIQGISGYSEDRIGMYHKTMEAQMTFEGRSCDTLEAKFPPGSKLKDVSSHKLEAIVLPIPQKKAK